MNKKGFTLTELMIAIAIVGILCAVLLPIIFNILPNQNTVMAKRAYYTIQQVVAELINDDACYPDKSMEATPIVGFNVSDADANCVGYAAASMGSTSTKKFEKLFCSRLDASCSDSDPSSFSTKDGMAWTFKGSFDGTSSAYVTLNVDVNGTDDPNCDETSAAAAAEGTNCHGRTGGFDIFSVKIYADGELTIVDNWAKKAINVNKDLNEE